MLRLLAVVLSFLAGPAAAVTLQPGDVLVSQFFVRRIVAPNVTEPVVPYAGFPDPIAVELAVAGSTPYAVSRGAVSTIARIDAEAMTATSIGSGFASDESVGDLVSDPSGVLYALTGSSASGFPQRLYRVNSETGARELVFTNDQVTGPLAGLAVRGLSFLDADTAILAVTGSLLAGSGGIFSYELATGAATLIAEGGLMTETSPFVFASPLQVAAAPDGSILVLSSTFIGGSALVELDPVTGAQRWVAGTGGQAWDLELTADGRTAYIGSFNTRADSYVNRVDVATGANQIIFSSATAVTGGGVIGVAIVPEPATGMLLALGLAALAARRRIQASG
jgi:hypothetical protein